MGFTIKARWYAKQDCLDECYILQSDNSLPMEKFEVGAKVDIKTAATPGNDHTTSRYATALEVYLAWVNQCQPPLTAYDFHKWINERLNSEKNK